MAVEVMPIMVRSRLPALVAGAVLLLAGAVTLPMPLPTGLLLLALGSLLLLRNSAGLRRSVRRLRADHPGFSSRIDQLARRLPPRAARWLAVTAPRAARRRRSRGRDHSGDDFFG